MSDDELRQFITEATLWMPYIYFRKMLLAHYEFIEDMLHV